MSTAEVLDEPAPELVAELLTDEFVDEVTVGQSRAGFFYGWLMLPLAML